MQNLLQTNPIHFLQNHDNYLLADDICKKNNYNFFSYYINRYQFESSVLSWNSNKYSLTIKGAAIKYLRQNTELKVLLKTLVPVWCDWYSFENVGGRAKENIEKTKVRTLLK